MVSNNKNNSSPLLPAHRHQHYYQAVSMAPAGSPQAQHLQTSATDGGRHQQQNNQHALSSQQTAGAAAATVNSSSRKHGASNYHRWAV
jgi:hypothetical protein